MNRYMMWVMNGSALRFVIFFAVLLGIVGGVCAGLITYWIIS